MTERKRQNLIQELFETEEKYLDNLKLVFEVGQGFVSFELKMDLADVYQTNPSIKHLDKAGDLDPFHQLERFDNHQYKVDKVFENQEDNGPTAVNSW